MKSRFLIILLFGFACLNLNAQKLTLNDLENICNKANWEYVNQFLMNKNWEYYESSKGDSEKYHTITWSFNKSYNDKASAWFYLYTYEGFPNKVTYSVFNKPSYTIIQKALPSNGYKLQNSEIEDNELISTYANSKFLIKITTEKREKDDYSSFDESITAYSFQLIKRSSVYDPGNGKKTLYFDGTDQIEVAYTLKNGKFEGEYKGYYQNGNLRIEGTYKNDLKNGLWKEYNEQGNLINEYNISNGELEGKSIIYLPEGKIKSSRIFEKGLRHGESVDYFYEEETKRLKAKLFSNYFEGKLNGDTKLLYIDENKSERILSKVHFENDLKEGLAQEISEDTLVIANYKNDKLHGSYKLYRDLTKLILGGIIQTDTTKLYLTDTGQYLNGLKTGYWKHYELTGGLSEGNYSKDVKTGPWKFYYSKFMDGEQPEPYSQELFLIENYINGKRNGISEYFSKISYEKYKCNELDENNKPKDSCSKRIYNKIHLLANYKDNELHGMYVMKDSLGKIRYKGNYNYGKEHGEWIESYTIETDQKPIYVFKEGNYNEGAKEGKWIQYINKGSVIAESNFKDNLLHGEHKLYYLTGQIKEVKSFNRDKLKQLKVYDSIGQRIEKEYHISSETYDKLKVRYINYFSEGERLEIEYMITKPKEELTHQNFRDVFHQHLQDDAKHYNDGEFILTNTDGSPSIKGYVYKGVKTGTWEHNYPKQNVKIVTTYINQSNQPNSETYYTLDTNELFNGDFIFLDSEIGTIEERRSRIRDGLRNGNTTYFDETGNKTKKEKYKDGLLKD